MSKSSFPKGALILHTPWIKQDGQPVGQIEEGDAFPTRCTMESELEKDTPQIVNRFLTWAPGIRVFESRSRQNYNLHTHDATHGHEFKEEPLSAGTITNTDKNNRGNPVYASSVYHAHDVYLSKKGVRTKPYYHETEEPIIHEPIHYEVNAYYCKEQFDIPVGTIVFYDGEETDTPPGWRDVAARGLSNQNGRTRNSWVNTLLKVVDCWPEARRQGLPTHTHDRLEHIHPSGSVEKSSGEAAIDDSKKRDQRIPAPKHTHSIPENGISLSDTSVCGEAENLPRCYNVRIFVCETKGARFFKDMLIPYIPRRNTNSQYPAPQGWEVSHPTRFQDPDLDLYPMFFKVVDGENEAAGMQSGNVEHTHKFNHSHTLSMTAASSTFKRKAKIDIEVAGDTHTHANVTVRETNLTIGKAPNILPNREVTLIRFTEW